MEIKKKLVCVLGALLILSGIFPNAAFAEEPEPVISNAVITVPEDATVTMAWKNYSGYNYKSFTPVREEDVVQIVDSEHGEKSFYFKNLTNNKDCYYRVSGPDYVTYAGCVTYKTAVGFALNITGEMLQPEGKSRTTVDRDLAGNDNHNVADVYLNVNEKGYLELEAVGDTYQLIPLRNWQTIDTYTSNTFLEPDYHYTVLNEDGDEDASVLEVSDSGVITAKEEGIALILVSYDAMTVAHKTTAGDGFYGAIWPENTGVVVVSVGAEESNIETGMTIHEGENAAASKLAGDYIDAEMDVIYFTGDQGEYTFRPETEGCTVTAANPTICGASVKFSGFRPVSESKDGDYIVPLTEGRNIVKISKGSRKEYQVITAKKLSYAINNGEEVHPGDSINIVFDTVYNPANKLAGMYNGSSGIIYKTPDGKMVGNLVGGTAGIYDIASNSKYQTVSSYITKVEGTDRWGKTLAFNKGGDIIVPEDYGFDVYTLSSGMVEAIQNQYSCEFGKHREVTLIGGQAKLNASAIRDAVFGTLPDIAIPIVIEDAEVTDLTVSLADSVKTYYTGDTVSKDDFTVTANYDNGRTQVVSDYTVSPTVLSEGKNTVTITYREKTAEIGVTAVKDEVTSLSVTEPPTKTNYKAGDGFDPSGMVVTAAYQSGKVAVLNDYSYEPKRTLETGDSEITITAGTCTAVTPIVVSEAGGKTTKYITVSFTLLGDAQHDSDADGIRHTLNAGNLTTWIARTSVSVPAGSTVVDVVARALGSHGIPFENDGGNYISSVRGLEEFANGVDSGWMYTLNGKHARLGVREQSVKKGDEIIFHYTDDFTAEQGSENWSSGSGTKKEKTKETTFSASEEPVAVIDVNAAIDKAGAFLVKAVTKPQYGSIGGEWLVFGLARSGYPLPEGYVSEYRKAIENKVRECKGVLHAKKYTEYSRVILALTAIGADPSDVAGYDLLAPLSDYSKVAGQGINGPVWALIALDGGGYEIPACQSAEIQATRQRYVDAILSAQLSDGGWNIGKKTSADADLTAMALQALEPYRNQPSVEKAVANGVNCLSKLQNGNGGFSSQGIENAESSAQVLTAMCTLRISLTDSRFVKNGHTVLDDLLSYACEDGSFSHTRQDASTNRMATEQALYALAAVKRTQSGQTALYDMMDVREARFPDVVGHINQKAIEALAEAGILNGFGDGTFAPDRTLTRAEFCTIAGKAFGLSPKKNGKFFDVADSAWYAGYVGAANEAGIVNGVGNGKFAPDGRITCEQALTMVCRGARVLGLDTAVAETAAETAAAFSVSDYAGPSVSYCLQTGIWTTSGELEAQRAILRCEAVQVIYGLYKLAGKVE